MNDRKPVTTWLTDMDGVLIHEGNMIPGADDFIRRLRDCGAPFLVLTNNSIYTPRDLRARLLSTGIDLPEEARVEVKTLDGQVPFLRKLQRVDDIGCLNDRNLVAVAERLCESRPLIFQ